MQIKALLFEIDDTIMQYKMDSRGESVVAHPLPDCLMSCGLRPSG